MKQMSNAVYTSGDQTIAGTKTFSSTIGGSITGNAGTVTNGVYTSGDQIIGGTKTFSLAPVISHASGSITFNDSGTSKRGIMGTVGGSDQWFFGGGATATNAGFLEISTGDDNGTEPIHIRQYQGGSPLTGTITRTLTLLDGSGNSSFPGSITSGAITCTSINTQNNNINVGTGTVTAATFNGNATSVTNGVYTSGDQTIASTKTFSGQIRLGNAASLRQNSTGTWTGDPGAGIGKLEYHSNRWYLVSGSDSAECLRVRRNATDVFVIDNSGQVIVGTVPVARISGTLPVANGGTGVTSSTGTGSVVLSASPSLTGTVNFPNNGAGLNWGVNYSRIYDDGHLRIQTDDQMFISAPSSLSVTSPTTSFSGTVSCTSITANGVNLNQANSVIQMKERRTELRTSYSVPAWSGSPYYQYGVDTDIYVEITPRRASSKIVLQFMVSGDMHHDAVFIIYRRINGTWSPPGAYNTTVPGTYGGDEAWSGIAAVPYDNDTNSTPSTTYVSWSDFPNTTGTVKYSIGVKSSSTAARTFWLNKAGNATTGQAIYEQVTSNAIATEIWV